MACRCQRDALEEAFPQDAELFPAAQANFGGEDVVLLFGNFFEQAAVDVISTHSAGWLSSETYGISSSPEA